MIAIGLIGHGYWGKMLARNIAATPDTCLDAIADRSSANLRRAAEAYPDTLLFDSGETLLSRDDLDAVVIATPLSEHYSLCKLAIQRGKHVLVEKPMVASVGQASELVNLARKNHVNLTVDHTFLYSGAVRKIRSVIHQGELGNLVYLESIRVNFGPFRRDTDVIWDLAVHDFSILDYLVEARPVAVCVDAIRTPGRHMDSLAHITVYLEGGFRGHFNVSWLAPEKVRYMVLCGDRRMIAYDDLKPTEKVIVYNKCIGCGSTAEFAAQQEFPAIVDERCAPTLDLREPLGILIREFVDALKRGTDTLSNGEAGVRVVTLLAAAEESARRGGARVCL